MGPFSVPYSMPGKLVNLVSDGLTTSVEELDMQEGSRIFRLTGLFRWWGDKSVAKHSKICGCCEARGVRLSEDDVATPQGNRENSADKSKGRKGPEVPT